MTMAKAKVQAVINKIHRVCAGLLLISMVPAAIVSFQGDKTSVRLPPAAVPVPAHHHRDLPARPAPGSASTGRAAGSPSLEQASRMKTWVKQIAALPGGLS
jgi:hypothetical protein